MAVNNAAADANPPIPGLTLRVDNGPSTPAGTLGHRCLRLGSPRSTKRGGRMTGLDNCVESESKDVALGRRVENWRTDL